MEKRSPDNTKIKMYTTSWCGPCKMAKKFLAEKGYNFEEVDIEENNISLSLIHISEPTRPY